MLRQLPTLLERARRQRQMLIVLACLIMFPACSTKLIIPAAEFDQSSPPALAGKYAVTINVRNLTRDGGFYPFDASEPFQTSVFQAISSVVEEAVTTDVMSANQLRENGFHAQIAVTSEAFDVNVVFTPGVPGIQSVSPQRQQSLDEQKWSLGEQRTLLSSSFRVIEPTGVTLKGSATSRQPIEQASSGFYYTSSLGAAIQSSVAAAISGVSSQIAQQLREAPELSRFRSTAGRPQMISQAKEATQ